MCHFLWYVTSLYQTIFPTLSLLQLSLLATCSSNACFQTSLPLSPLPYRVLYFWAKSSLLSFSSIIQGGLVILSSNITLPAFLTDEKTSNSHIDGSEDAALDMAVCVITAVSFA